MEEIQIASHDNAAAAELPQDIAEHSLVRGKLFVKPDIAQCQADFLQHMKNNFQFFPGERLACNAAIKCRQTHQRLPVHNGHYDLCAQKRKLSLDFRIAVGFVAVPPQDMAVMEKMAADAGLQRQFQAVEDASSQPDGARGAQTTPVRDCSSRTGQGGLAQENCGTIDAGDFTELKQKLLQQRFCVQGV